MNTPLTSDGRSNAGFIRTYTGQRFCPTDPQPGTLTLRDVAHSLSQICRFTGHTRKFYSVGQHSVYMSWLCEKVGLGLWGLGHDAEESTTNDCNTILKHAPGMEGYRQHASMAQKVILHDIFGLTGAEPAVVKTADLQMLLTEQRDLMPCDDHHLGLEPLDHRIKPWSSRKARRVFLLRFAELTGAPLKWYQKAYLKFVRGRW